MAKTSLKIIFLLFSFLVYQTFITWAISSPSMASSQFKFWNENVINKMPTSIIKKLSPLNQNEYDGYINTMPMVIDPNFCSAAKLSCSVMFKAAPTKNKYTSENQYNNVNVESIHVHADDKSFFRISVLKNGNFVHLPNLEETIPDRAFLPSQMTSKIQMNLDEITKIFPDSPAIDSIKTTLSYCNSAPLRSETKSCPKSLEEMIIFSKKTLGNNKIQALTSKSTIGSNTKLMIKNMKQFNAKNIVACHEVFLPFATYFCHSIPKTNLYSVDLVEPKSGAPVNTLLAICHMDTSSWPEKHVAFQILKFKPGEGEACHWFSNIDIAWISNGE